MSHVSMKLPFGERTANSISSGSEFIEQSTRAGRPIADATISAAAPFRARVTGVRLGEVSVGAVCAPSMQFRTYQDSQLAFLLPVWGSGSLARGSKSIHYNGASQIIRSTYHSPLEYRTGPFCMVTIRPDADALIRELSVNFNQRNYTAESLRDADIEAYSRKSGEHDAYSSLFSLLSIVDDANCDAEFLLRIGIDDAIHKLLASILANSAHGQTTEADSVRVTRSRLAVDLICDHIRQNIGHPLTIAKMERLTGLSGRSLNYAFQSRFNCSPQEWQRGFLLDEARARLRSPGNVLSVKGLAFQMGFSSAGSFSRHYRRKFGELPSVRVPPSRPPVEAEAFQSMKPGA